MKKFLFTALIAFAVTAVSAQNFPQPSPLAKVSQMVGLTEVSMEYYRPGVNDREIFGKLLPYGTIWRTGANGATKITFEDEVTFGGQKVPAGTYAILTVPSDGAIVVMLNSDFSQGGTSNYDTKLDVATVKTEMKKSPEKVERMRFTFENITNNSADLVFNWDHMTFSIPVMVDTDAKAQINLEKKMKEFDNQYSFYNEAASYYLASGKDPKQALAWAEQSVEMQAKFWNTHTLAKAYHANGDTKNAISTAERSMALAKDADYQAYIDMNEAFIASVKRGK